MLACRDVGSVVIGTPLLWASASGISPPAPTRRRREMTPAQTLCFTEVHRFLAGLFEGDLHAKRVLSLANVTLGVLKTASLAMHTIGQGLALARGRMTKQYPSGEYRLAGLTRPGDLRGARMSAVKIGGG